MSEYTTVELEMNDADCIKQSLQELGYVFEEHKEAQPLFGYQNDKRSQKANIIIRRQHVGAASNDVGLVKEANGKYRLIISEFDRRQQKQGGDFLQKMKQYYGKNKLLKECKKHGYVVKGQKINEKGEMKIKIIVNR